MYTCRNQIRKNAQSPYMNVFRVSTSKSGMFHSRQMHFAIQIISHNTLKLPTLQHSIFKT